MRRILITGENSYIGTKFKGYMSQWPEDYEVTEISVRGNEWKEHDFSRYDVVFHVAGIAHVPTRSTNDDLYYKVNRDLAIEVAKKSKKDGIKQFIFMSSIIVYGDMRETNGKITRDTIPNPKNAYGDSKLQAEKGIKELEDDQFTIAILRPPMIYGPDSKGNYQKLVKFAKISPIFPDYPNKRSMLHIDNLLEFLKQIIDNQKHGLFFPQNKEYVCTSQMVKEIAESHGKNIKLVKIFNPFISLLKNVNLINKVFGSLYYTKY